MQSGQQRVKTMQLHPTIANKTIRQDYKSNCECFARTAFLN